MSCLPSGREILFPAARRASGERHPKYLRSQRGGRPHSQGHRIIQGCRQRRGSSPWWPLDDPWPLGIRTSNRGGSRPQKTRNSIGREWGYLCSGYQKWQGEQSVSSLDVSRGHLGKMLYFNGFCGDFREYLKNKFKTQLLSIRSDITFKYNSVNLEKYENLMMKFKYEW